MAAPGDYAGVTLSDPTWGGHSTKGVVFDVIDVSTEVVSVAGVASTAGPWCTAT
jgi:hypothetical protein